MKHSRFSEEQIIGILNEQETGARTADVCRKHGVSEATFYKRKSSYGGPDVSEEAMLDNAVLKDVAKKMVTPA
jgi:putative transposase